MRNRGTLKSAALALALALTADGVLGVRSQFTLSAAQPLRVAAGRANFNLPQGVTINAPGAYDYLYLDRGISMAASGREVDYMAEYSNAVGRAVSFRVAGLAMTQPGRDATARVGFGPLVGLKARFR